MISVLVLALVLLLELKPTQIHIIVERKKTAITGVDLNAGIR